MSDPDAPPSASEAALPPEVLAWDREFLVRHRMPRPVSRAYETVCFAFNRGDILHRSGWAALVALHFVQILKQACHLATHPEVPVNPPSAHDLWRPWTRDFPVGLTEPLPADLLRLAGYQGGPPPDPRAGLLGALAEMTWLAHQRVIVPDPGGFTVLLGPRMEYWIPCRHAPGFLESVPSQTPIFMDPTTGRFLSLAPFCVWDKARGSSFGHLFLLQLRDGDLGHYTEEGIPGGPGRSRLLEGRPILGTLDLDARTLRNLETPPARFQDRMLIPGQFRVHGLIWRGGTSDVFVARRLEGHGLVAVKTFEDEPGVIDENFRRFVNEERLAASIIHPRIVRPLAVRLGKHGLVHEQVFMPGGSLEDLLEANGVVPPQQAVLIIDQVLEALGAIHAARVAHNDIKPDNILFGDDTQGRPTIDSELSAHLIDFGISSRLEEDESRPRPGAPPGSPGYIAPELLAGKVPTIRSDLFAVGTVFTRMVTGELPRDAVHARSIKGIPGPIRSFLDGCLAEDPRARFGSVDEARRALRAVSRAVHSEVAITLDIEATLVTNYYERIPRPGLRSFLRFCMDWFDRVFIYTMLDEPQAREVFLDLERQGMLPEGFLLRYDYVDWPRGAQGSTKDLRRCRVPLAQNAIVDDTREMVPADQRHRWIPVPDFSDAERPDRGLPQAMERIKALFGWV